MELRRSLLLPTVIFLCFSSERQIGNSSSAKLERLGTVSFRVSCSAAVQPEFDRAVALLHSFQYATAGSSFAEIAKKDQQCAMAYWGEAMSLFHPLFDWPDKETLKKGNAYVDRAAKMRVTTDRERAYIRAAAVFYRDDPKLDRVARLNAYSSAMADAYRRYPEDGDAASFYALSLLPWYRDDQPQARLKALSILKALFAREPNNPGAVHYLIHAADSPELAPQGLEAARRYAEIAPSSAHALHMPAHIFSRLGLWQDSIDSNLASAAAAAEATKSNLDNESEYQLHAMHYLLYAYLQRASDIDARHVVEDVRNVPGIYDVDIASDGNFMKAIYIMETKRWEDAAQLVPTGDADPFSRMRIHWARTIAECHLGKTDDARKDVEHLHEDFSTLRETNPSAFPNNALVLEGEAWLAHARGNNDEAVDKMRAAIKADVFSVDDESLPAYELLGDLLLELQQPAPALEAYEAALKEAPNRFNSLHGAGLAAELTGNQQKAMLYYANLVKIADPRTSRPEFLAAKVFLQNNKTSQNGQQQLLVPPIDPTITQRTPE